MIANFIYYIEDVTLRTDSLKPLGTEVILKAFKNTRSYKDNSGSKENKISKSNLEGNGNDFPQIVIVAIALNVVVKQ